MLHSRRQLTQILVKLIKEGEEDAGSWRKHEPFPAIVESLATLSPAVIWKVKNALRELNDVAKEVFRWGVKSASWILLAAYSKM